MGNGDHTITLTDYEIANLRELLLAIGYPYDPARPLDPNPFNAANTGDWVGQIAQKLPAVDGMVCAPAEAMAKRARELAS